MAILVIRRPGHPEETIPLPEGEATVGRLPDNQVVIDDHSVSRRHALISPAGEGHTIRDLESKNGTFVNGQRVGTSPAPLHSGDQIALGRLGVLLRYYSEEGTVTGASGFTLGSRLGALGLGDPWSESKRWFRLLRVTPWLRLVGATIGVIVGVLALAWWIIQFVSG